MYGCMDVWIYECIDVRTYGCMDVWMYGCVSIQRIKGAHDNDKGSGKGKSTVIITTASKHST